MKKYYKHIILMLIVFCSGIANAQDKPAASEGSLTFYLDYACFEGSEGKSLTEFYIMFYGKEVIRNSKDNRIKLELNISDQKGKHITASGWVTEISNYDSGAALKVIYDKTDMLLIPGNYTVVLTAELYDSELNGKAVSTINVPSFNESKFSLSMIKFLTLMTLDSDNLSSNPNPSRRYGILNPQLFFTYEVYGAGDKLLEADYSIEDKNGIVQKSFENIQIKKQEETFSVMHGIDVSALSTGLYNLKISLNDNSAGTEIRISRMFEIIQTDFFENKPAVTEEQAAIFRTILEYIGNSAQMRIYESLDLEGKSRFMIEYWKSLDPNPATEENEFLKEIQNRFSYAKNKFGWGKRKGWESDRGRICIKYGIPHQVTQYNYEATTNPYEVWTYNEGKTYEFIFGDISSNGQYILLHSNREGEIYNVRWREQIERM